MKVVALRTNKQNQDLSEDYYEKLGTGANNNSNC